MTTYVADHETGNPLCPRCSVSACIGNYECRDEGCRCACRIDPDTDRARELDDREPDKLAVIANELDRERTGDLRELTAERFGRPTRRAA